MWPVRMYCLKAGAGLARHRLAGKPTVPQTAATYLLACGDAASGLILATYSPDQVADPHARVGVARSMEYDVHERAVARLPLR